MCLHHTKGWNLATVVVFIAQMSCFLEDVSSFDSRHQFRTPISVLTEAVFWLKLEVGRFEMWAGTM